MSEAIPTTDLNTQAEQLEKQQQKLISESLEKRKKSIDLAKRIKDLEAQKAIADKEASAAERSLDTHYKCMGAGILYEAMRKGTLSDSARAEIVKLFDAKVYKISDRAEIKRRYVGFETLPDKKPTPKPPKAAEPVKCKCGVAMVSDTWKGGDHDGKPVLRCPIRTTDNKADHDFKLL